jgi:hypothetical protein
MSRHYSAALPIAWVLLRLLVVLNWFVGAAILVLLLFMPTERWIMTAMELSPGPEAERMVMGLHAIAAIGLLTIPMNHVMLTRLLDMVGTVRRGDPFIAANAYRLRTIAWTLLALQLLGLVMSLISAAISTPENPVEIGGGFSPTAWLAVFLTFVLSRVFVEGSLMRDELEGTI